MQNSQICNICNSRRYHWHLKSAENVLITGQVDREVLGPYTELSIEDLEVQLAMFQRMHKITKLSEGVSVMQGMSANVRCMFCEVEKLLRLLLVCPCSSAEAERSFSSLRRLKTWLRSTMTQTRLNSVAVCHCHQELLDNVDLSELMREFVCCIVHACVWARVNDVN